MQQTIEKLSENVIRRWDTELGAVVFEVSNSDRDSIDVYIESNLETLKEWDKSKPLYMIQDVSNEAVSLTPYLQGRLKEVMVYIKDNQMQVCTALVLTNNLSGQMSRVFGRLFTTNVRHVKQSYFTDMASARNWIASQHK